jgi:hypothetical protein
MAFMNHDIEDPPPASRLLFDAFTMNGDMPIQKCNYHVSPDGPNRTTNFTKVFMMDRTTQKGCSQQVQ